ncbi:hypothetical protein P3875_04115 [Myroides sp. JBRI-B21084]|uniref:hypothetical protein n=1 Tax=Myroides sp. JBRI-B21084 TaxID=3119977 RepID=UPI0026E2AC84|nr:hypothetical protein [Paenimyroides cloacae]WKW47257.1 hypothetical protein P3875_04115 [Paenimyroides cloacae]
MEQIVINIIDTHTNYTAVEKFTETGAPILTYSGGEARFASIMSSKFSFNILNETAEDGKFLDLLTGEERRFLIEIRNVTYLSNAIDKDAGLIWRGFLLPDIYSEPYENGCFFVGFTATDGLDVLKTKPFLFYKTNTVIDYIVKCLWETGLHQEIYFAPAVENAFHSWDKIQLFDECFTKFNEDKNSFDFTNCFEVLDQILTAIGATLYQNNGKWFITGFNRKANSLDEYSVYSCFGNFLRKEQVLKPLKKPLFNTGVNISITPPNKSVQLNVSYQQNENVADFTKYVHNDSLTNEEYVTCTTNDSVSSISPFNLWKKSGACKIWLYQENDMSVLKINNESNVHDPNELPVYQKKPPFFLTVSKIYGPPHDFENDYIELKSENTVYLSPQVEGKYLNLDIDFEFKIFNTKINNDIFDQDFYRQAVRVDVMIGNSTIFSTRSESLVYSSEDVRMHLKAEELGPSYMWYTAPYNPLFGPKYVLPRFITTRCLVAEVSKNNLKVSDLGKLNVRIYLPRNGDSRYWPFDHHVSEITITKLEIKVKGWEDEKFVLNREIRYTTKHQTELSFADGKNDLYLNLFKINDRESYPATFNEITLFNSTPTQDVLYYYFEIPGIYGDYVTSRYSSLKLYNGQNWFYAHFIFGLLNIESGIEFTANKIRISKARIDEFPHMRTFLNGISKITVGQTILKSAGSLNGISTTVPAEQYLSWKRWGNTTPERYLTTYAKMIHECTAVQAVTIEGTALDIIYPNNIVEFNFLGPKKFIPTSLSIDFSNGKTKATLVEDINQTNSDYATT